MVANQTIICIFATGEVIEKVVEVAGHWPDIAKECNVPYEMVNKVLPNMCLRLE